MNKSYVFRKVIVGNTLDETIANCHRTYEEGLNEALESDDDKIRIRAERDLKVEKFLDSLSEEYLPEELRGMGHSRLQSVYAWPFEFPDAKMYPSVDKSGITVMKLRVDGSHVLVMPMSIINEIYNHDYPQRKVRELAEDYWSSAVTLDTFTEGYREVSSYIFRGREGYVIERPEVLIPSWELPHVSICLINDDGVRK